MNKTKLVWSDDPKDKKCSKCGEFQIHCRCEPEIEIKNEIKGYKFVAIFRLEKGGRGGKTVTVIEDLPKNELFLKELCSELKKKCGVGGTYSTAGKEGLLEIQGDKREQIKALFVKKGIRYKGM